MSAPVASSFAHHWTLDPHIVFLNHGSFGACPRTVQAQQLQWQERLERQPVTLLVRELEGLLVTVRGALGAFLGCQAADLALVENATEGVNTVIRSLHWNADDEVLMIDHAYNACLNAAKVELARSGGRLSVAQVPFPLASSDEVVDAIIQSANRHTRLAVIDHITSPSALVLPIKAIVDALQQRGIDVLVDGAHAPGTVPLNLDDLGAAYYTGNCHKWLCGPKGAAFLHVRADRQARIRPLVISHGANSPRQDISRFRAEFDWTGTRDPSPWLCIPAAVNFLGALLPGGWPALRQANHLLALQARDTLCEALGVAAPCPDAMLGSMAALILPPNLLPAGPGGDGDPLYQLLWEKHRVEVPVMSWGGRRLLRISAQLYNDPSQYLYLAEILANLPRS